MKRLDARRRRFYFHDWRIALSAERLPRLLIIFRYLSAIVLLGVVHASYAANYTTKADYLVKFAKYVTWPKASGDITLCVIGPDPFGSALDKKVAGQTVKERKLVTRRLGAGAATGGCEILFVSDKLSGAQVSAIIQRSGQGTLTVSDFSNFIGKGGMIEFFVADGNVRFEINNSAARKAGLKLSSNLLKLASKK